MFKDQVIAITGAGSGIGRALAQAFASAGARLALADIRMDAVEDTMASLGSADARSYRVDVSSYSEVEIFAASVRHDFGRVDYIVNNAGTSVLATFDRTTLDEIKRVLDVNLWGVIHGSKAFLPILLEQGSGCIVNVSSVFGLVATPCSSAYSMSKFAVRGLTETLWIELGGTGVRAVLVHPGGIDTNIKSVPTAANESEYDRKVKAANVSMMTTDPRDCAREILTGLASGTPRLLVGNGAKQLFALSRLFPNSYAGLIRKKLGI